VIPLGFHRFDLLEKEFQPVEFAADLSLEMDRQRSTIAGRERVEPAPAVAVQGLTASSTGSPR
jgi:hypothetical protein